MRWWLEAKVKLGGGAKNLEAEFFSPMFIKHWLWVRAWPRIRETAWVKMVSCLLLSDTPVCMARGDEGQ